MARDRLQAVGVLIVAALLLAAAASVQAARERLYPPVLEQDEALLSAYLDSAPDHRSLAAVRLMRFMGAFFEAMWGVVQQGISELDFDFVAYARDNFERLRAIGSDPSFGDWLEAAAERRILGLRAASRNGNGRRTTA